jgi:hypothetical protein
LATKKSIFTYFILCGIAAMILSVTDVYDKTKAWLSSQNLSLQGLEFCLYDKCAKDNQQFVSTVANAVGRSVDVDFVLDIPIGIGDFNARCVSKLPYLYAPEGTYFIPSDLDECNIDNGMIFEIPKDNQLPVEDATFSQKIRVKGTYNISTQGSEPRYMFTKE